MLKVPNAIAPYNFSLIGQEIGELTVDLGKQIVQEYDDNKDNFDKEKDQAAPPDQSPPVPDLSRAGWRGRRERLGPAPFAASRTSARPGRSSRSLTRRSRTSPGRPMSCSGLAVSATSPDATSWMSKLIDLKTFLAQNPPKDRHLVPGGPEFAPNAAEQVAGAPGQ